MIRLQAFSLILIFLFSFFPLCSSPATATANAVPDPTEQFRPFVATITEILSSEDFKDDSRYQQCQRIIDVARDHFDFREMSKRTLGKQWRKLSNKERDEFVDLFTRLLQHAYIGKVEDYSGQEVEFVRQRIRGKRAQVQTLLVDKSKSIPVSYIMLLKGDKWMAYDVVVEGVSLVRNYMEQFREILRKEDYAGLVKQLERKIQQLEDNKSVVSASAG